MTVQTLIELGGEGIPVLYVYNKADKVPAENIPGPFSGADDNSKGRIPAVVQDSIYLSAREKIGMEELVCLIEKKLAGGYRECAFLIPYADGRAVSYLNENAVVFETEYRENGVYVKADCKEQDARYYEKYKV